MTKNGEIVGTMAMEAVLAKGAGIGLKGLSSLKGTAFLGKIETLAQTAKAAIAETKVPVKITSEVLADTAGGTTPILNVEKKSIGEIYDAMKSKASSLLSTGVSAKTGAAVTASGKKAVTADALEHVFHGEVKTGKKGARSVGFHYEGAEMQATKKTRVVTITKTPDAKGVYEAEVEIQGISKKSKSSFFPKTWTKNDVVNAINEAYINKTFPDASNALYFEGKSSSGVIVGGYLNADGTVATAFPLYGR